MDDLSYEAQRRILTDARDWSWRAALGGIVLSLIFAIFGGDQVWLAAISATMVMFLFFEVQISLRLAAITRERVAAGTAAPGE
jgi:hypothetical protein